MKKKRVNVYFVAHTSHTSQVIAGDRAHCRWFTWRLRVVCDSSASLPYFHVTSVRPRLFYTILYLVYVYSSYKSYSSFFITLYIYLFLSFIYYHTLLVFNSIITVVFLTLLLHNYN